MKDCCKTAKKNKKCKRRDKKIFSLPRKFSKKSCMNTKIKGFTMRSSCAPYKFCKKSKKRRQTKPNQTKLNQIEPNQTKLNQTYRF